MDCWGFVRHVYKNELGIDLPSFHDCYNDSNDPEIGETILEKSCDWQEVEPRAAKPFDVVILRLSAAGAPCHVGLIVREGVMIHMRRKTGVVIQPLNGLEWKRRIHGLIRYGANAN